MLCVLTVCKSVLKREPTVVKYIRLLEKLLICMFTQLSLILLLPGKALVKICLEKEAFCFDCVAGAINS